MGDTYGVTCRCKGAPTQITTSVSLVISGALACLRTGSGPRGSPNQASRKAAIEVTATPATKPTSELAEKWNRRGARTGGETGAADGAAVQTRKSGAYDPLGNSIRTDASGFSTE